ncbi:UNVERIFIED_CONTAM: hypothetical protein Sradi_3602400 [Sesamum radiatum]|uniref:Uncharacterized protein n=1 Tax=Sesamum radiatum TaxID=300843 RepID=A0AAW2QH32_SESRA
MLTISCGRVLKVKTQTTIFMQVQFEDEDDWKSVASSNYTSNGVADVAHTCHITLIEDGEVEEEDIEYAPLELEEGIKATIDELKKVNSNKEISWLDPKVVVDHLSVKKGAHAVKQGSSKPVPFEKSSILCGFPALSFLLKKVVAKSKRDWHGKIRKSLWVYKTTVRTLTQATPYALLYEVKAVLSGKTNPIIEGIDTRRAY